jgi:hypothetical protein
MNASERADPKAGPFGNLSQAYFGQLDMIAKGLEPALKGVGRWNIELMALMTRRARAWAEIPSRLGQCKSPQDLIGEQLRFWQAAAHDYADGAQRLTVAFGALAVPGLNGALGAQPVARDYITFAEPKPEPAVRDRRAA